MKIKRASFALLSVLETRAPICRRLTGKALTDIPTACYMQKCEASDMLKDITDTFIITDVQKRAFIKKLNVLYTDEVKKSANINRYVEFLSFVTREADEKTCLDIGRGLNSLGRKDAERLKTAVSMVCGKGEEMWDKMWSETENPGVLKKGIANAVNTITRNKLFGDKKTSK